MSTTSATSGASDKRVISLQALRGIAAGMVVLAHCVEHAPGDGGNTALLTGRFGVEIFFVISGFVIAYVAGEGRFDPMQFMSRRIWRVVPLYWVLTLVVAGAALLTPGNFNTTRFSPSYLLSSLAFIPAYLPGTHDLRPLFKLGWTLNYEMFFYLAVAALFWCRTMKQRAAILSCGMLSLAAASMVLPRGGLVGFYANLNLLPFVVGLGLAVAWRAQLFERLPRFARYAAATIALTSTLRFYFVPFAETKHLGGHMLMTIAAAAIGIAALAHERQARSLGAAKWLGDISYSLYLTHMFVVGVAWAMLKRLHVTPFTLVGAVAVLATFAGSLAVAHFTFCLFERPLMRLRLRSTPATAVI